MALSVQETVITLPDKHAPVQSLSWLGDVLVDWVGGEAIFRLDGSYERAKVNYAYRFDTAIASPSGQFAAIYERCGTKGLVLERGKVLREINRSFYQAHAYNYPITFVRLADGREILAHCPNEYNQLELEDARTGERLARSDGRKPADYFFSDLAASPSGKYLLSGGWCWQPYGIVHVYAMREGLADPRHLDGCGIAIEFGGETGPACFASDDSIITSDTADYDSQEQPRLRSFTLPDGRLRTDATPVVTPGQLMAVGHEHVFGFHEYPRLISLSSGVVQREWPELPTGKRASCISWGEKAPPLAFDPLRNRFAVATATEIRVIQLTEC